MAKPIVEPDARDGQKRRAISPWMAQLARFGMVGIAATGTHYLVALLAFYLFSLESLSSNIVAYLVALAVSLFGQTYFTFRSSLSGKIALRFAAVSLSSLALTLGFTEGLYRLLELPFWLSLTVTLMMVPLLTFVFQKLWVYRS